MLNFKASLMKKRAIVFRRRFLRKGTLPKEKNKQSSPDIEKIRQEAMHEERIRMQKKLLGSIGDVSK